MAGLAEQPQRMTSDEFLRSFYSQEGRFELRDGVLIAIVAATRNHERIVSNIHGQLYVQLRGKTCQPTGSKLKVKINAKDSFQPDVGVDCKPAAGTGREQTYGEARFIVEVHSPSTEADDKGPKLGGYMAVGVPDILYVHQDKRMAVLYRRTEEGDYLARLLQNLSDSILFADLGVTLSMSDVYEGVIFPEGA